MNILNEIVEAKKEELKQLKISQPHNIFENSTMFNREIFSLSKKMNSVSNPCVIAEFKRKSPSKGIINDSVSVEDVVSSYCNANATAVSVLTNKKYFMGDTSDLIAARKVKDIPILRKEFIVDEYQLLESKAIGADVILLIAAALDIKTTKHLAKFAKKLGLEVILEIHNEDELKHINEFLDIVGVNNRNLSTFNVDISTSLKLYDKIPKEFVKISESGISNIYAVRELYNAGYNGFLIGETFMKTDNPGKACKEFIEDLNDII